MLEHTFQRSRVTRSNAMKYAKDLESRDIDLGTYPHWPARMPSIGSRRDLVSARSHSVPTLHQYATGGGRVQHSRCGIRRGSASR